MSPRRGLPLLAIGCSLLAAVPAAGARKVPPHGKLISKSRVTSGLVPQHGTTYRVLYSSQAVDGRNVATSGLVTIPAGRAPKGGFPVVSWAHGTTGIADACAPSRLIGDGAYVSRPYTQALVGEIAAWVKRGYAVVQSDYQGLGTPGTHPYLVGVAEGRSVLDIVLAARGVNRRVGKRFAIVGHSQGGHATLWAAALAERYTPALKLAGAVPLAPASHIGEQGAIARNLDSNPFGSLAAMIGAGAAVGMGVAPETIFSDAAMALYPQIEQRCADKLGAQDSFGGLSLRDTFRAEADPRPLLDFLSSNDPEDLTTISAPLLVGQGTADGTVLPTFTDQLVEAYQARGMTVTYTRYEGVDHQGVVAAARADTDAFLRRVLGR